MPTLELALALSGAVSGGAYTAGALDFIVQALDAWHSAAAGGNGTRSLPHAVALRAMAGTSSGALTASILAAALPYRFVPVDLARPETESASPLFDGWVNMTDITHLLDLGDQSSGRVASLFDPTRLNEASRKAMDFGHGLDHATRPWVGHPLHVVFTVSNTDGVAFPQLATGSCAEPARLHAVMARHVVFGLGHPSERPPGVRGTPMPDEVVLSLPAEPLQKWSDWKPLVECALASAAFPLALPPRRIQGIAARPGAMRVVRPRGEGRAPAVVSLTPAPDGEDSGWLALDGGVCGPRSPVAAARDVLVGRDPLARVPAEGEMVLMAVLEIDAASPAPAGSRAAGGVAAKLLRIFLSQQPWQPDDVAARQCGSADLLFRLAPAGHGRHGHGTAGGFLGGFGGYLSRAFRRHDFLLGRRDAQRFLIDRFTLPANHPLFAAWPVELRACHLDARGRLPIVPLHGELRVAMDLPEWPWGAADLVALPGRLRRRLRVVLAAAVSKQRWWLRTATWLFGGLVAALLAALLVRAVRRALQAHDLA